MANSDTKVLIGPHAGYTYSAATLAEMYKQIPADTRTIVLLGPSHKIRLDGISVSECKEFETPIGNVEIDRLSCKSLLKSRLVSRINLDEQENEHSLELHLPFIKHVVRNCKLIPILVGHLNQPTLKETAQLFLEYFRDPSCLFIVSSDFCHYGSRFNYVPFASDKNASELIQQLDMRAVDAISKSRAHFEQYLKQTQNTICGRNPILLVLEVIELAKMKSKIELLHYKQSGMIKSLKDSSVSYASIKISPSLEK